MSYCRWSSDDFKCDIYCYESETGYEVHVATMRVVEDVPPIDWATHESLFKTYKEQMEFMQTATRKEIGLPFDGESFSFGTAKEAVDCLIMLRNVGYNVPEYAIEALLEEVE